MLCPNCSKLAAAQTNKTCSRCQAAVFTNISVICDACSASNSQCSVCLKKIIPESQRNAKKGCNCGKK